MLLKYRSKRSEVLVFKHELLLLVLLIPHDVDSGLVLLLCLFLHYSESWSFAHLVEAEVVQLVGYTPRARVVRLLTYGSLWRVHAGLELFAQTPCETASNVSYVALASDLVLDGGLPLRRTNGAGECFVSLQGLRLLHLRHDTNSGFCLTWNIVDSCMAPH